MKTLFLFFSLFSLNLLMGQQQCSDIIYLLDGDSISNCCITNIEVGNQVTYFKKNKFKIIEAIAISRSGQYLDLINYNYDVDVKEVSEGSLKQLNNERDYNYYQTLYKNATTQRNVGIAFTSLAAAFALGGGIAILGDNAYLPLVLIGIAAPISLAVGIPLWVSGQRKRNNNKIEMDEIEKQMQLGFGATNNGIGLVFNF
jgi:hypothetical protein